MMSTPTPPSIHNALSGYDKKLTSCWLQDASRAAELADVVFSVERETMYIHRLIKTSFDNGKRIFTFEPVSAPASRQPFCDAQMDSTIRKQALYFNHCTLAVMIGAPFLAYLSTGCDFRVREYNMYVKPKVMAYCTNTGEHSNDPLHSVLFLSPSFIPSCATAMDPFEDPGFIIDPSAAQMGFEDNVSCAAEYVRDKLDSHPHNSTEPLGFHLRRFYNDIDKAHPSPNEHITNFRREATIRAICNIVFREIKHAGGPRAIMDLDELSWKQIIARLRRLLQEGLAQLRAQLDSIDFSTLSKEDRRDQEEELMSLYDQEGYTEMTALVRNEPT